MFVIVALRSDGVWAALNVGCAIALLAAGVYSLRSWRGVVVRAEKRAQALDALIWQPFVKARISDNVNDIYGGRGWFCISASGLVVEFADQDLGEKGRLVEIPMSSIVTVQRENQWAGWAYARIEFKIKDGKVSVEPMAPSGTPYRGVSDRDIDAKVREIRAVVWPLGADGS